MNEGSAGLVMPSASECRWDLLSLSEIMLRFDPGEERMTATRNFRVWQGGWVQRWRPKTASRNEPSVLAFAEGKVYRGIEFADLDILDRVGSGNSFGAGLIFGLMQRKEYSGPWIVVLATTTPGDS